MIPWKFLNLTPRDQSGELLRVFNRQASVTAASTHNAVAWSNPFDKALVITSWSILASTSGAGPLVTEIGLDLYRQDTGAAVTSQRIKPLSGPLSSIPWVHHTFVIAPPQCNIFLYANYSAADPANFLEGNLQAMQIPRGDAAYV